MKPEQILQSNFLDILFDNRNKQYGAYPLRKEYNNRLTRALIGMLVIAVAVCLFIRWTLPKKAVPVMAPLTYVKDVELKKVDEIQKPKEKEKVAEAAPAQKKVASIDHVTPVIVPDNAANKNIPTQEDMEGKLISNVAVPDGDLFDGVPQTKPAEIIGKGSGGPAVEEIVEVKPLTPVFKAQFMPEFPGGQDALMKFMLRNLREPENLSEGEKLVVMVRFTVDIDGAVKDAMIIKSGGDFDKDVLRAVGKMPRWKPGMQDGRMVPVYFQMPVTFVGGGS